MAYAKLGGGDGREWQGSAAVRPDLEAWEEEERADR
jgi:hypothetical protein